MERFVGHQKGCRMLGPSRITIERTGPRRPFPDRPLTTESCMKGSINGYPSIYQSTRPLSKQSEGSQGVEQYRLADLRCFSAGGSGYCDRRGRFLRDTHLIAPDLVESHERGIDHWRWLPRRALQTPDCTGLQDTECPQVLTQPRQGAARWENISVLNKYFGETELFSQRAAQDGDLGLAG